MCIINEMSMCQYMTLLKNPSRASEPRTLVFGNGFGLSHPEAEVSKTFHFDMECVIKKLVQFFLQAKKRDGPLRM